VSARDDESRSVYRSNGAGSYEIYAWDRSHGEHRQVTDRSKGTLEFSIPPDGADIWWFADTDGDEFGHWMIESFLGDGEPARAALADVPDGYPSGIALGATVAAVGLVDDDGFAVWFGTPGEPSRKVYTSEDGILSCISADDTLVAIMHAEHDDSRNPGIRILHVDGSSPAEQLDPGKPLVPLGWAPAPSDSRLLVQHERNGRPELLVWDIATGKQDELAIDLPGELTGGWYPDGGAVLVRSTFSGRSTLHRFDLASKQIRQLPTSAACIGEQAARRDGSVEYSWSSPAHPHVIRPGPTAHGLQPARWAAHRGRGSLRRHAGGVDRRRLHRGEHQPPWVKWLRGRVAQRHHRQAGPDRARGRRGGPGLV
jgi:hypothetical protein